MIRAVRRRNVQSKIEIYRKKLTQETKKPMNHTRVSLAIALSVALFAFAGVMLTLTILSHFHVISHGLALAIAAGGGWLAIGSVAYTAKFQIDRLEQKMRRDLDK